MNITRRWRRRSLLTLLAALAVATAACGTTDSDEEAGGDEATTTSAPEATPGDADDGVTTCDEDDTATSTDPVSLTDSYGRAVELDAPAEKVVVLEWQQIEDVVTLCVEPAAVADVDGYGTWVSAAPLPDGVADVGTRGEPSFDAILAAAPDLVIVEAYTPEDEIISQLEDLGLTVLATKGADAGDPIQNMLDTFGLIAEATGRTERAEVVAAEFEAKLAAAKAAVSEVELEVTDFVYLDGWVQGGNISLRPFGQGSLVGELGEELGLSNAWTGEVDEAYGLGQTDIEGMSAAGEATILYTGTVDPDGDFVPQLLENPIWQSLPAVGDGRVHAFPAGTWTFGGPWSSLQIIDAYVDVLTS